MLAQTLRERHPPLGGVDVSVDGLAEEDLVLSADVVLDRGVPRVFHPRGQVVTREQGAADNRAAEKLVDALPDLADDRVGLEGLIEDARHVAEQLLAAFLATYCGRGADADQSLAGHPEPRTQAPDEACQIGALGAVEGVQLVHHQVTQGVRGVEAPESVVDRPDQQEIQHLVVGEEDVGRTFAQGAAVRDDVVRPHGGVGRALAFADVEARAHPAAQRRGAVDGLRDPPGLVHRQGVHRIDEDRLDALLTSRRAPPPAPGSGRGSDTGSTPSCPSRCRWR